jgi:hypothetical protein
MLAQIRIRGDRENATARRDTLRASRPTGHRPHLRNPRGSVLFSLYVIRRAGKTLRQAQGDKLGNRAKAGAVANRGNRRDARSTSGKHRELQDGYR